ncbi:multiple cyclophane-containing RiPP AmcA [Lentzea sp. NBRC 102530]|uniref:multiple cyclophane-containing RiPP AmcA n=1 Tax=Lentzea sp. NBRC 102530 TaxID=3032201 RepID=UPI0024A473DD|nr:multiple cyclophane-containing RiPP AmcA [Lentzea sp. NBRC 102530]GLY55387.1 hypothetical protein Lesp01_90420 [Lentzea sp. NBRC 102530]
MTILDTMVQAVSTGETAWAQMVTTNATTTASTSGVDWGRKGGSWGKEGEFWKK